MFAPKSSILLASLLFGRLAWSSAVSHSFQPRSYTISGSCSEAKQKVIKEELQQANKIAQFAQNNYKNGNYFPKFFPTSLQNDEKFNESLKNTFANLAKMATSELQGMRMTITCNDGTVRCNIKNSYTQKVFPAHTTAAESVTTINFCDLFSNSATVHSHGGSSVVTSTNKFIKDSVREQKYYLKNANPMRSRIILHELTHTKFAMNGQRKSQDVAYGVQDCLSLSENRFIRGNTAYGKRNFRT